MRFKAKLAPEQVYLLHSLLVPLSRLSSGGAAEHNTSTSSVWMRNGSILYLDNTTVRLSCQGKTQDTTGMTCFSEMSAAGGLFLDFRIESVADNNAIVLELDLVQLRTALKSVMSSNNKKNSGSDALAMLQNEQSFTILKLAKRSNFPCLCVDAACSGKGGGMIQVHHAIPVRILRASEMQHHLPPQIPLPDVQLELSEAAQYTLPLRTVIERIRSMSPTVYLEASLTGELTLSVHTDGASIRTFYSKLIPRMDENNTTDSYRNKSTTVKVDTKKLCAALQWQQPAASTSQQQHFASNHSHLVSTAMLCLVENEMLVIHANLNPAQVGFFTYYVPVHFLSSDPAED